MSSGDYATGSEVLTVAAHSPQADAGAVRTDFRVDRWDAEQTEYVRRMLHAEDWLSPNCDLTPRIFDRFGVKPYSTTVDENCNLIVQNGWVALLGGVAGTTMSPKFGAANARIGVGTSSTAAAYAQTTLQGDTGAASTTSYFKLCSGAPTIATGSSPATLTFTAVFGTAVANFAWNEFGSDAGTADSVSNATTGGTFFNRGVSAQGTKASGQTWTATETISFGYPSGAGTVS
jgi:hypothetical protein